MSDYIDWDDILDEQANDLSTMPVTPGWYDVTVSKAEATVASTGSPMIKLAVKIEGGPYDDRWVWTNLVFNRDSAMNMRMTLRRLAAFGLGAEYLATAKPTLPQLADALMDRQAQAEVNIRRWNEEDRNDVNMFKPRGVGTTASPPAPTLASDPMAPAPAPMVGTMSAAESVPEDEQPF